MAGTPYLRDILASPDLQGAFGLQIVRQTYPGCGAVACVATILRSLGIYAAEGQIMDSLVPNRVTGANPEAMIRYFHSRELMVSGYRYYPAEMIIGNARAGKLTMLRRTDRGDHWVIPVAVEPIQQVVIVADPSLPGQADQLDRLGAQEPSQRINIDERETCFSCVPLQEFTDLWNATNEPAIVVARPSNTNYRNSLKNRTCFLVQEYRDNRPSSAERGAVPPKARARPRS
jgi:hypothetical protein